MKIMDKFGDMLMAIVVFALVVVLIVALAWLVGQIRTRASGKVQGFIYILPVLIMLLGGLVYPAILTIRQAFGGPTGDEGFGVENFVAIFTRPELLRPLINTAIWVICVPVFATIVGLAYAVLVDRSRFEAFAKALIFLPMAISMVGASIIWKFMYDFRAAGRLRSACSTRSSPASDSNRSTSCRSDGGTRSSSSSSWCGSRPVSP